MIYISNYKSPIGNISIASKDNKLVGVWIEKQKYYLESIKEETELKESVPIIVKTKQWLEEYFDGKRPEIDMLELNLIGTEFRKNVWKVLKGIPYGKTITYNDIAKQLAEQKGIKKMSAQAVRRSSWT